MTSEMKLPQLGENVDSGVVLTVLVSPGDQVEEDQPILEIETDKATTEVPATFSGTVEEVVVDEGDEISGGQTILTYSEQDEEQDDEQDEEQDDESYANGRDRSEEDPEDEEEKQEARDRKEEKKSKKKDKDKDKEAKKKQRKNKKKEKKKEKKSEKKQKKEKRTPPPTLDVPVAASPAVRQLARELGVAIDDVAGTGDGGRVLEDDVKAHVRSLLEKRPPERSEKRTLPDFSKFGQVRREPMTPIRRAVARNVSEAWEHVPHVTQFDKADITDLERFQKRFHDDVEQEGGKLTITAILLKVCARALERFPSFNATLDLERAELIVKEYVHIGIAVDTEQGLLVPVIRDVNKKGLAQIAADLVEITGKARARKISRDELQGASFAISNLGALGTTHFTPIVGHPQVAILSVGRAEIQPVYQNGEFVPRNILPLGITYDHRAVDGADAARFLRWIIETLEEPLRLTLESSG